MKSVAILLFTNVQSLDVAGLLDVFAEAHRFVPAEDGYLIALNLSASPSTGGCRQAQRRGVFRDWICHPSGTSPDPF